MPRLHSFGLVLLLGALLASRTAFAAGFENFVNFPETGSTYNSGTFTGQDGSTWTYTSCRGDQEIADLPTPTLAKGKDTPASILSGTLSNGCGTLPFDWMRPFASTCNFDVVVNSTVITTYPGGEIDMTNHVVDLPVNIAGNFTLMFRQHDTDSGQVSIDNILWTSHGTVIQEPPTLSFSPDITHTLTEYGKPVQLDVSAYENNLDTVRLWAEDLPAGAVFAGATGAAPLMASFAWTPAESQTGTHAVAFFAGDKDGTNSRTFSIEVTPIYPYYHYAEGQTGPALKAKLHDIISDGAVELNDEQENDAMKDIHTDPSSTNYVMDLYNPASPILKTAYDVTGGWNKEHCWPESRGLGNDGPDQVDLHNLYAAHKDVNNLRGALFFDVSDTNDAAYLFPAHPNAPLTSMDTNSFQPPLESAGNIARALFYMATRYDGSEEETNPLGFADAPTVPNLYMGILNTLLRWHALDPPDDWERARNERIFTAWQHNRNPFVDRPEWAEAIWGTDSDGDGVTDTHEWIAGTATNDLHSVFEAGLSGTGPSFEVSCGLLSSGSVWRLYEGNFNGSGIVWHAVAETNRLQSGTVRFPVAPTSPAAFYHLRATRP